ADRVLVETDSPFLTPEPFRGKENEPALVVVVGAALARARGVEAEEIAETTRRNAGLAFGVER
ncbi:MAG TPA: TatD family hydrolase, partial [Acidimicrobiia bacterium]